MGGEQPAAKPAGFPWSTAARQRMETVPDFIRPMAMNGIEQFAKEAGYPEVTEAVLDEARERLGM